MLNTILIIFLIALFFKLYLKDKVVYKPEYSISSPVESLKKAREVKINSSESGFGNTLTVFFRGDYSENTLIDSGGMRRVLKLGSSFGGDGLCYSGFSFGFTEKYRKIAKINMTIIDVDEKTRNSDNIGYSDILNKRNETDIPIIVHTNSRAYNYILSELEKCKSAEIECPILKLEIVIDYAQEEEYFYYIVRELWAVEAVKGFEHRREYLLSYLDEGVKSDDEEYKKLCENLTAKWILDEALDPS